MFLNSLIRSHDSLPDDYRIIGFDNSPISYEAVIPTSTVGQQIDKIAETAMEILVEQMNERKKRKPVKEGDYLLGVSIRSCRTENLRQLLLLL